MAAFGFDVVVHIAGTVESRSNAVRARVEGVAALLQRIDIPAVVQLGAIDDQLGRRWWWATWRRWHCGSASTGATERFMTAFASDGIWFEDQTSGAVQSTSQTTDASVVGAAALVFFVRIVAVGLLGTVEVNG